MSYSTPQSALLDSYQFREQLFLSISACEKSFVACSAFIKRKALEHEGFSDNLESKKVVVVARWQKHDLLTGASDLAVYDFCKQQGWLFGINLNLHGKLFLIDEKDIFLGSANLTQRGLHIGLTGNLEFGTRIPAGQADISKINNFIASEVTWMDDELYELIEKEVHLSSDTPNLAAEHGWSEQINNFVNKPVEYLWVQELVFKKPSELLHLDLNDDQTLHDFDLLALNLDDLSETTLKASFKRLRLFRWLYSILKKEGSLSFGGLSAQLHNAILDDPRPYRVDIKKYNEIIFAWAAFISDEFEISRPSYSQVIRLREK